MPPPPLTLRTALVDYCNSRILSGDWRACLEVVQGCALTGQDLRVLPYRELVPFLAASGQWSALESALPALLPPPLRASGEGPGAAVAWQYPQHPQQQPTERSTTAPPGEVLALLSSSSSLSAARGVLAGAEHPPTARSAESAEERVDHARSEPERDLSSWSASSRSRRRARVGESRAAALAYGSGTSNRSSTSPQAETADVLSVLLLAAAAEPAGPSREGSHTTTALVAQRQRAVVRLVRLAAAHQLPLSAETTAALLHRIDQWLATMKAERTGTDDWTARREALIAIHDALSAAGEAGRAASPPSPTVLPTHPTAGPSAVATAVVDALSETLETITALVPAMEAAGTAKSVRTGDTYARAVARLERYVVHALRETASCARLLTALQQRAGVCVTGDADRGSETPPRPHRAASLAVELAARLALLHTRAGSSEGSAASAPPEVEWAATHAAFAVVYADAVQTLIKPSQALPPQETSAHGVHVDSVHETGAGAHVLLPLSSPGDDLRPDPRGASAMAGVALAMVALTDVLRRASHTTSVAAHDTAAAAAATVGVARRLCVAVATLLEWAPYDAMTGRPTARELRARVRDAAAALAAATDAQPTLLRVLVEGKGGAHGRPPLPWRRFILQVLDAQRGGAAAAVAALAEDPTESVRSAGNESRGHSHGGRRRRSAAPLPTSSGLCSTTANSEVSGLARSDHVLCEGLARLWPLVLPAIAGAMRVGTVMTAPPAAAADVLGMEGDTDADADVGFDLANFSEQLLGDVARAVRAGRQGQWEGRTHTPATIAAPAVFQVSVLGAAVDPVACAVATGVAVLLHPHPGGSSAASPTPVRSHDMSTLGRAAFVADIHTRCYLACLPTSLYTRTVRELLARVQAVGPRDVAAPRALRVGLTLTAALQRATDMPLEAKAAAVSAFMDAPLVCAQGPEVRGRVSVGVFEADPEIFRESHARAMALEGSFAITTTTIMSSAAKMTPAVAGRGSGGSAIRALQESLSPLDRLIAPLVETEGKQQWARAVALLRCGTATTSAADLYGTPFASPLENASLSQRGSPGRPLSLEESAALRASLAQLARARDVRAAVALFYTWEREGRRLSPAEVNGFAWAVRRGPLPFVSHVLQYAGERVGKLVALAAMDGAVMAVHRVRSQGRPTRSSATQQVHDSPASVSEYHERVLRESEDVIVLALRMLPREGDYTDVTDTEGGGPVTGEELRRILRRIASLYTAPPSAPRQRRRRATRDGVEEGGSTVKEDVAATLSDTAVSRRLRHERVLRAGGVAELPLLRSALADLQRTVDVCALTGDAGSAVGACQVFLAEWTVAGAVALPPTLVLTLLRLECARLREEPPASPPPQPQKEEAPSHENRYGNTEEEVRTDWGTAPATAATRGQTSPAVCRPAAETGAVLELIMTGLTSVTSPSGTDDFLRDALPLVLSLVPCPTRERSSLPEFVPAVAEGSPGLSPGAMGRVLELTLHRLRCAARERLPGGTEPMTEAELGVFVGLARALLVHGRVPFSVLEPLVQALSTECRRLLRTTAAAALLSHWLWVMRHCSRHSGPLARRAVRGALDDRETDTTVRAALGLVSGMRPAAYGALERHLTRLANARPVPGLTTAERLASIVFATRCVCAEGFPFIPAHAAAIEVCVRLVRQSTDPLFPAAFLPTGGWDTHAHWRTAAAPLAEEVEGLEESNSGGERDLRAFSSVVALFDSLLRSHRRLQLQLEVCGAGGGGGRHALQSAHRTVRGTLTSVWYTTCGHYLVYLDYVASHWRQFFAGHPLSEQQRFLCDFMQLAYFGVSATAPVRAVGVDGDSGGGDVRTPTEVRVHHALRGMARGLQRSLESGDRTITAALRLLAAVLSTDAGAAAMRGSDADALLAWLLPQSSSASAEATNSIDTAPLVAAMLPLWFHLAPEAPMEAAVRLAQRLLLLPERPVDDTTHVERTSDEDRVDVDDTLLFNLGASRNGRHGGGADHVSPSTADSPTPAIREEELTLAVLTASLVYGAGGRQWLAARLCSPPAADSLAVRAPLALLQQSPRRLWEVGSATTVEGERGAVMTSADDAVILFLAVVRDGDGGGVKGVEAAVQRESLLGHMLEELSLAAPHRHDLALVLLTQTPLAMTPAPPPAAVEKETGADTPIAAAASEQLRVMTARVRLGLQHGISWPAHVSAAMERWTQEVEGALDGRGSRGTLSHAAVRRAVSGLVLDSADDWRASCAQWPVCAWESVIVSAGRQARRRVAVTAATETLAMDVTGATADGEGAEGCYAGDSRVLAYTGSVFAIAPALCESLQGAATRDDKDDADADAAVTGGSVAHLWEICAAAGLPHRPRRLRDVHTPAPTQGGPLRIHPIALTARQYVATSVDSLSLAARTVEHAGEASLLWRLATAPTLASLAACIDSIAASAAGTGEGKAYWIDSPNFLCTLWAVVLLRAVECAEQMIHVRRARADAIAGEHRAVYVAMLSLLAAAAPPSQEMGRAAADPRPLSEELLVEVAAFALDGCLSISHDGDSPTRNVDDALDTVVAALPGEAAQAMVRRAAQVDRQMLHTVVYATCTAGNSGTTPNAELRAVCQRFRHSLWAPLGLERVLVTTPRATRVHGQGALPTTGEAAGPSMDDPLVDARHPAAVLAWLRGASESEGLRPPHGREDPVGRAAVGLRYVLHQMHAGSSSTTTTTGAARPRAGGLSLVVNELVRMLYTTPAAAKKQRYVAILCNLMDEVVLPDGGAGDGYLPGTGTWHMLLPLIVERAGVRRRGTAVSDHIEAVQQRLAAVVASSSAGEGERALPSLPRPTHAQPQPLLTKRDCQSLLLFFLRSVQHARTMVTPLGWHDDRWAVLNRCWTALVECAACMARNDGHAFPRADDGGEVNMWSPALQQALWGAFAVGGEKEEGAGDVWVLLGLLQRCARSGDAPATSMVSTGGPAMEDGSTSTGHTLTASQLLRFLLGSWRADAAGLHGCRAMPTVTPTTTTITITSHRRNNSSRGSEDVRTNGTAVGGARVDALLWRAVRSGDSARLAVLAKDLVRTGTLPTRQGWEAVLAEAARRAGGVCATGDGTTSESGPRANRPAAVMAGERIYSLYAPYMTLTSAVAESAVLLAEQRFVIAHEGRSGAGGRVKDPQSGGGSLIAGLLPELQRVRPLTPVTVAALMRIYWHLSQAHAPYDGHSVTRVGPARQLLWIVTQALAAQHELAVYQTWTALLASEASGDVAGVSAVAAITALRAGCIDFLVRDAHHARSDDEAVIAAGMRLDAVGLTCDNGGEEGPSSSFLTMTMRAVVALSPDLAGPPLSRARHLYTLWRAERAAHAPRERARVEDADVLEVAVLHALRQRYAAEHSRRGSRPTAEAAAATAAVRRAVTPFGLWRQALAALAALREHAHAPADYPAARSTATTPPHAAAPVAELSRDTLEDLCAAQPPNQWALAMTLVHACEREAARDAHPQSKRAGAPPLLYTALQYMLRACQLRSIPPPALLELLGLVAEAEEAAAGRGAALTDRQRRNRLALLESLAGALARHPRLRVTDAADVAARLDRLARVLTPVPHSARSSPRRPRDDAPLWQRFCHSHVRALHARGEHAAVLQFIAATGCAPAQAREGRGAAADTAERTMRALVAEAVAATAPHAVAPVMKLLRGIHAEREAAAARMADGSYGTFIAAAPSRTAALQAALAPAERPRPAEGLMESDAHTSEDGPHGASPARQLERCLRHDDAVGAAQVVRRHPYVIISTPAAAKEGAGLERVLEALTRRRRYRTIACFALELVGHSREGAAAAEVVDWWDGGAKVRTRVLVELLAGLAAFTSAEPTADPVGCAACAAVLAAALLRRLIDGESGEEVRSVSADAMAGAAAVLADTWAWLARTVDGGESVRVLGPDADVAALVTHVGLGRTSSVCAPDTAHRRRTLAPLWAAVSEILERRLVVGAHGGGVDSRLPCMLTLPLLRLLVLSTDGEADGEVVLRVVDVLLTGSSGGTPAAAAAATSSLRQLQALLEGVQRLLREGRASPRRELADLFHRVTREGDGPDATAPLAGDARFLAMQWRGHRLFAGRAHAHAAGDVHVDAPHVIAVLLVSARLLPNAFVGLTASRVRALVFRPSLAQTPALQLAVAHALLRSAGVGPMENGGRGGGGGDGLPIASTTVVEVVLAASRRALAGAGTGVLCAGVVCAANALVTDALGAGLAGVPLSAEAVVDALACRTAVATAVTGVATMEEWASLLREARGITVSAVVIALEESARRSLRVSDGARSSAARACTEGLALLTACTEHTREQGLVLAAGTVTPAAELRALADALVTCALRGYSAEEAVTHAEHVVEGVRVHDPLVRLSPTVQAELRMVCVDAFGAEGRAAFTRLTAYRPTLRTLSPASAVGPSAAPATSPVGSVDGVSVLVSQEDTDARLLRALALVTTFPEARVLLQRARHGPGAGRTPVGLAVYAAVFEKLRVWHPTSDALTRDAAAEEWLRALEECLRALMEDGHTPTSAMLNDAVALALRPRDGGAGAAPGPPQWRGALCILRLLTLLPPVQSARHRGRRGAATESSTTAQSYVLTGETVTALLLAAEAMAGTGVDARREVQDVLGDAAQWYAAWSRPSAVPPHAFDAWVRLLCRAQPRGGQPETVATLLQEAIASSLGIPSWTDTTESTTAARPATAASLAASLEAAAGALPDRAAVGAVVRLAARQQHLHHHLPCSADGLVELFAAATAVGADGAAELLQRIAQDAAHVSPRLRARLAMAVAEQSLWAVGRALGTCEAGVELTTCRVEDRLHAAAERAYVAALARTTPADSALAAHLMERPATDAAGETVLATVEESLALLRRVAEGGAGDESAQPDLSLPYRELLLRWGTQLAAGAGSEPDWSALLPWLQAGVPGGSADMSASLSACAVVDVFLTASLVRMAHARGSAAATAVAVAAPGPGRSVGHYRKDKEQLRRLHAAVMAEHATREGAAVALLIAMTMSDRTRGSYVRARDTASLLP